jgi:hypothetical protein
MPPLRATVDTVEADPTTTTAGVVDNSARARSKGFEADIIAI